LLLGKGGQTVYLGDSVRAKPYFENLGFQMPADENPADWFMDVLSGEFSGEKSGKLPGPKELFHAWEQSRVAWTEQSKGADKSYHGGREWSTHDDVQCVESALYEAFDQIGACNDLDKEELGRLVAHCTGIDCPDEVVEEIWGQVIHVGGPAPEPAPLPPTRSSGSSVTRRSFLSALFRESGITKLDDDSRISMTELVNFIDEMVRKLREASAQGMRPSVEGGAQAMSEALVNIADTAVNLADFGQTLKLLYSPTPSKNRPVGKVPTAITRL